MSKRALNLHNKHSKAELVEMMTNVQMDPKSREGAEGIYLYNPKAMKLLEDIQWALYWHRNPKGNTETKKAPPDVKWW